MQAIDLTTWSLGASGFLFLLVIWLMIKMMKLERLRKEFFSSGVKKNLEQVLVDQNRSITTINKELADQAESINEIETDIRGNFQKIGFLRFNPFDDAGGNISFTLALLNAHNDGIVISSLHGRDGTRVYAKSVKSGMSESQLTQEELKAIKEAN